MKQLLKYLKPYWYMALLAPIFMIGEVSMDLTQPALMSKIVDEGVWGNSMEVIWKTGLLMLGLLALGGVFGVLSNAIGSMAAQNFGNDLRKATFEKVMHLSIQQTDKFTTGSLVTRLTNDITAVQEFVASAMIRLVRVPMQFIGGIFMILTLGKQFGLILAVTLPIQMVLVFWLIQKAGPIFSVVQKKLDKVNSVVQENVSGARVVKAYVQEEHEKERFDRANTALKESTLKVQKLMAILNPLLMIIMNATVIAVIYIGGWQAQAGQMQVGNIMAAITYATQILMSVMMLSMLFQSITRALASAQRIQEILNTEPAIGEGAGVEAVTSMKKGSVTFRNVSFYYPGFEGKTVLQNINLEIQPGETVAILAATGQGKTSLVNLIPRFYDVTEGEVLVNGVNVKDYPLDVLRKKIGFVLQKSELFSGTIQDNIKWGSDTATHEEVVQAATIAQADDFIQNFQDGYDTIIGEKGSSLSGGQKQRLSIARAILKKPEILIFDDSTSALDTGTDARLRAALREHLADTTVIMIAQRVASVMTADRILVLENGEIAACGNHEELLANSSIYQDIYYSQMKQGGEANG